MKLREHLTYANVAATLALAGVIGGGGAYAAGVIDSGDIENNSIQSKDLKNRDAVTNRDVSRDALKGRAIKERTLDAAEFAPMAGDRGSCDPDTASFDDCASTTVRLRAPGRLLVLATGEFFSEGAPANLTCRIFLDGENTQIGVSPGEASTDNTDLIATDGFAETLVTGRLPTGQHSVALRCSQADSDDARLGGASIAVLGISG